MRIEHLPGEIRGLAFDIDRTLYTNEEFFGSQIDALTARLAAELGGPVAEAQAAIEAFRAEYARTHDGDRPSLGNTFVGLGIPMETSVRWREELIDPSAYLRGDARLREALIDLGDRFRIVALTNNPRLTGVRTLEALGVADCFRSVIGLDTTMRSKPDPAPFVAAREALGLPAEQIVMIGDRYEVDLVPALDLGMGAVLVDGVADVYLLPSVLASADDGVRRA